jgi:hypothetical protein
MREKRLRGQEFYLTVWQLSHSLRYNSWNHLHVAIRPHAWNRTKMIMSYNWCGLREERSLNHAKTIMKITGKLKFVKFRGTSYTRVAKSSAPDEKSRTRRKYRPKLLREPGKLQEIISSKTPGNLGVPSVLLTFLRYPNLILTSKAISTGWSTNPFRFPRLFSEALVWCLFLKCVCWSLWGARGPNWGKTRRRR